MKLFITIFAILTSLTAFAETPSVIGREVTCQELQETLSNYGSVTVRSRFLGIPTRETVYESVECSRQEEVKVGSFVTKDARDCHVGQYCAKKESEHHLPSCLDASCVR